MKQKTILIVLALCMCTIGVDNINAQTKKPVKRTTTQVRKASSSTKPASKNSREYKVENDGFEWYLVCKNGKYGAESRDGKEIVPSEYQDVHYGSMGKDSFFYVEMNNSNGLYDTTGKCIIPYSRHYVFDWVLKEEHEGLGSYYRLCRWENGTVLCEYICDANGKEMIKMQGVNIWPKFENGYFYYYFISKENHGIANAKGEIIVQPQHENIYFNEKDVYYYCDDGNNKKILSYVSPDKLKYNPFAENAGNSFNSASLTTPSSNKGISGINTTTVIVEQHGPVQVWVACGGCQLSPGRCSYCNGSGWGYNNRLCSRCNGTGKCTICNGTGGHNEVHYR